MERLNLRIIGVNQYQIPITGQGTIPFMELSFEKDANQRVGLLHYDDFVRLVNYSIVNHANGKVVAEWVKDGKTVKSVEFDLSDKETWTQAQKNYKNEYKELQEKENDHKRVELNLVVDNEYVAIMLKHAEKPMETIRDWVKSITKASIYDYKD